MKLWGGGYKTSTDALMEEFNASIDFDKLLLEEDIKGSMAHVKMLCRIGILNQEELETILKGLGAVESDIKENPQLLTRRHEDIHMNIEALLTGKIGGLAKKMHTGRSRNDQVALDMKLYAKKMTGLTSEALKEVLKTLLKISQNNMDVLLPGYTHLQRAQPVRLSFHLMAYFEMFKRDLKRFEDAYKRMDSLPLGSGAFAGVSYESDRGYLKDLLDFKSVTLNAMDAVSDRDYLIELQSSAAITMMHISRYAEEMIIWSSSEFNFISFSDAFTTGSSIMPQKKNPDACELLRGKTGRVFGNLMSILTVMKGLPLAYNKDMQEDKESIFDTFNTLQMSLSALNKLLEDMTVHKEVMAKALSKGFLNATDLADYLVYKGMTFRQAHTIVSKMTSDCSDKNMSLEEQSIDSFKVYSDLFENDVFAYIDYENVIERKLSFGSTKKAHVEFSIKEGHMFLDFYDQDMI